EDGAGCLVQATAAGPLPANDNAYLRFEREGEEVYVRADGYSHTPDAEAEVKCKDDSYTLAFDTDEHYINIPGDLEETVENGQFAGEYSDVSSVYNYS